MSKMESHGQFNYRIQMFSMCFTQKRNKSWKRVGRMSTSTQLPLQDFLLLSLTAVMSKCLRKLQSLHDALQQINLWLGDIYYMYMSCLLFN